MDWNDIYEELTVEMKRNQSAAKSLSANNPADFDYQIEVLFDAEMKDRALMDVSGRIKTSHWWALQNRPV